VAEKHRTYGSYVVARLSVQIKGIEVMEAVISLNTDPFIAVGDITKLEQFPEFRTSKLADGLPADFPMLRCPIANEDAKFIPTSVIRYRMNFACLPANNLPVMTMLFQINGAQIYWLADLTDPEVWAAYDRWKEAGRLPILLDFDEGNERDCTLCVPEIPRQRLAFEGLRGYDKNPPADYVWKTMATISASGVLRHLAVSVLPDVRLERVLVNLLATNRVQPFVKGRLHDAKPKTTVPSF
jgi:hypothetical protein